jgi:DNA-binding NarL/FixJ family response regulator
MNEKSQPTDEVKRMRVLLADDQAKVRSALRLMLEQQPDIQVLGEAVDTTGLLDWLKAVRPDIVLLDWELPGLPRHDLLSTLRAHCPHLKVIALSGRPEARQAALAAGADAFVSKGDPPEQLLAAVNDCCHRQHNNEFRIKQMAVREKIRSFPNPL